MAERLQGDHPVEPGPLPDVEIAQREWEIDFPLLLFSIICNRPGSTWSRPGGCRGVAAGSTVVGPSAARAMVAAVCRP